MPVTSIQQPHKSSYILVKFAYRSAGSWTYLRYTDCADDVVNDEMLGGSTYTFSAIPDLTVGTVVLVGNTDEKVLTLEMTRNTFASRISNGLPHAPVYVKVWEVMTSADSASASQIMLFRGRVSQTVRNAAGSQNRVRIECTSMRTRITAPLGMPANHHCINIFTDDSMETGTPGKMCRINANTYKQTGTITVVAGKVLTITGLTTPSAPVGTRYWHRGYVEYDGCRVMIRDWINAAATTFRMMNFIPSDWAGKSVTVMPGCDHTIEVCRARWSNEENFNGFGYKIPSFNPTFEKA